MNAFNNNANKQTHTHMLVFSLFSNFILCGYQSTAGVLLFYFVLLAKFLLFGLKRHCIRVSLLVSVCTFLLIPAPTASTLH